MPESKTTNFEEFFKEAAKAAPILLAQSSIDGDIGIRTNFWENLYQAFKARMENEKQI